MNARANGNSRLAFAAALCATIASACGGGGAVHLPAAQSPIAGPGAGAPSSSPAPGSGTPLTGPSTAPNGGWGAPALATALDFPVQHGFDGSGLTIAIVTDAWLDQTDLHQYLAFFKIPVTSRRITGSPIDGGPVSSADAEISALELQTIASLAPGANIIVYETPALGTQAIADAYNRILADGAANVIVSPFASCELASDAFTIVSPIVAAGTQNARTFVAASGDRGAFCTAYPASDPNVIGVGGTETAAPSYSLTSTTAWNDFLGPGGSQEAAGGGASQLFAVPSYQQGLVAISPQLRNVPDVAMPAAGAAVYFGGRWLLASSTAWSASQFGALVAEVYQRCGVRFLDGPALPYVVFARAGYSAFIDVVNGDNAFDGFPGFAAQRGYDNTSGIGVPRGMPFADALCLSTP